MVEDNSMAFNHPRPLLEAERFPSHFSDELERWSLIIVFQLSRLTIVTYIVASIVSPPLVRSTAAISHNEIELNQFNPAELESKKI